MAKSISLDGTPLDPLAKVSIDLPPRRVADELKQIARAMRTAAAVAMDITIASQNDPRKEASARLRDLRAVNDGDA